VIGSSQYLLTMVSHMMDYKSEIQELKRRVAALEACKHEKTVYSYTPEGFNIVCTKCKLRVGFEPRVEPDFNNYEIG
jgi:hypothetical protein